MLADKYQIVFFRTKSGSFKIRVAGWMGVLSLVLLVAMAAGNAYLYTCYDHYQNTAGKLALADQAAEEQKNSLLRMASKLKTLEQGFSDIHKFEAKLRRISNLNQDNSVLSSTGGPANGDDLDSMLPLYRQDLLVRKMHKFLHRLSTEVQIEESRQQSLMHAVEGNLDAFEATPSIWVTKGWVSSPFGYRTSPFTGQREFHKGLDISGKIGEAVFAPANGKVIFTGEDGNKGVTVRIDHGNGLVTAYSHLQKFSVKKGQDVVRGDLLGFMGKTGKVTGPQLYYEVRLNDEPIDPMNYILQ